MGDDQKPGSTPTASPLNELDAPPSGAPAGQAIASQNTPPATSSPLVPSPVDSKDEKSKQEFLWNTHQYINEYMRFGDTKAAFVAAFSTALIGALYTAKFHVAMVQLPLAQWTAPTWLAAFGGGLLALSVLLALHTIRPRLTTTQSKGIIFWQSIRAHGAVEAFQASFHSQSGQSLNDHLLHHNFDLSGHCITKYRAISLSILALALGAVFAASALMFQDVPSNSTTQPAPSAASVPAGVPPCKSGASTCAPWERDWKNTAPKVGTVVTPEGVVVAPH